ncbi:MAG: hypothetical protein M9918_10845 [Anaerolineae bacterium]|nr:hypothetical protein [Anaerolineae bacterium]
MNYPRKRILLICSIVVLWAIVFISIATVHARRQWLTADRFDSIDYRVCKDGAQILASIERGHSEYGEFSVFGGSIIAQYTFDNQAPHIQRGVSSYVIKWTDIVSPGTIVFWNRHGLGIGGPKLIVEDCFLDTPREPSTVVEYREDYLDLDIPPGGVIRTTEMPSTFELPILDINVGMIITHPNLSELEIWLVSPTGISTQLIAQGELKGEKLGNSEWGVCAIEGEPNLAAFVDDDSPFYIVDAVEPYMATTFLPHDQETFSALVGESPAGEWVLDIRSASSTNIGKLCSWTLSIEADLGLHYDSSLDFPIYHDNTLNEKWERVGVEAAGYRLIDGYTVLGIDDQIRFRARTDSDEPQPFQVVLESDLVYPAEWSIGFNIGYVELSSEWQEYVLQPMQSGSDEVPLAVTGLYFRDNSDDTGKPSYIDDIKIERFGSRMFVPLVANHPSPDLIIEDVQVNGDLVSVTIANAGSASVSTPFWVDLYVDPDPVPTGVNHIWSDGRSQYGLVWGVTSSLAPGETMVLTRDDAFYHADLSDFPESSLSVGTPVYVQVDSANVLNTYGGVLEIDELIDSRPYNNIFATMVSESQNVQPPKTPSSHTAQLQQPLPPRR